MGRPSIAPEMLLRAMLLQAFYSIRSERQLMERLEFDLLFRWFVGLGIDDPAWDPFELLEEPGPAAGRGDRGQVPGGGAGAAAGEAADLQRPLQRRRHADRGLGFDEELQAQGRRAMIRRRRRAGATSRSTSRARSARTRRSQSTTDPEARLYRKGAGMEARLCFIGHTLMENRSGLIVDTRLTCADGHAERIAALSMIEPRADRPPRHHAGRRQGL